MFSRSSNKFIPRSFQGYVSVGYVKAAHGLRGEVYVQLQAGQADWLKSLKTFFLLLPGQTTLSSWPVAICRPHKKGLIVKLNGCEDRNHSETLRKSSVYIAEELLVSAPGERIFLKEILNFTLCDPSGKKLGVITGFAHNGAQDLLEVRTVTESEALIPFVDDFILDIDFEQKLVKMDLPEGLIE